MRKGLLSLCILGTFLSGCNSDDTSNENTLTIDFSESNQNFKAIFSEYYANREAMNNEVFYQLEGRHDSLPTPFDGSSGWYLAGMNRSDDLFMSIKGYSQGWSPETHYDVVLSVTIVTNVNSDCVGIGGAPGESVYVKLGASTQEPINTVSDDTELGTYRPNIDKGNQVNSGVNATNVGNIASGIDCEQPSSYVEKTLTTAQPIDVRSDEQGGFWVLAGSDSGFEGFTDYYIRSIRLDVNGGTQQFDFAENDGDFSVFFSDYPPSSDAVDNEQAFQLVSDYVNLPAPQNNENAWYLSGNNKSSDLFMGVTGYVNGYTPNETIDLEIHSSFVTNTPDACGSADVGVADALYVKHIASPFEPSNNLFQEFDEFIYVLTVDKGNNESDGPEGYTAGNLGNNMSCNDESEWVEVLLKSNKRLSVDTDESGGFWVTVGVDSASEHSNQFYLKGIGVVEL